MGRRKCHPRCWSARAARLRASLAQPGGGSFASVALLSGKSGADIRDKVSRDVAPTWLTGVCYWPFVMALTFRVVPLRHRALSSAGFGAVWHIYLSSQANKAAGDDARSPLLPAMEAP